MLLILQRRSLPPILVFSVQLPYSLLNLLPSPVGHSSFAPCSVDLISHAPRSGSFTRVFWVFCHIIAFLFSTLHSFAPIGLPSSSDACSSLYLASPLFLTQLNVFLRPFGFPLLFLSLFHSSIYLISSSSLSFLYLSLPLFPFFPSLAFLPCLNLLMFLKFFPLPSSVLYAAPSCRHQNPPNSLCHSLSLSVSLCRCLLVSVCLSLSLFLSLCYSASLSLSSSLCLCLSLSLSLSLSNFLPSFHLPHPHHCSSPSSFQSSLSFFPSSFFLFLPPLLFSSASPQSVAQ